MSQRSRRQRGGKIASGIILRVAVAGAGAFGRNHLRVYRELEDAGLGVALVGAVEPDPARATEAESKYSIPVYSSIEQLLTADLKLNAATVAVPTVHHHAVASALLDAGLDLLVEKPLAASLSEADDLIARAQKGNRILQPGHLERFNPAVLAVEHKIKRPMFFEAHRLSIFTPRALDVDVVLDLMIHDLDVVMSFVNSPITEIRAVGLPILSPKVDIANVRMEFASGCVANFTASRVSTERVRKLRFFQPKQYVSIDYSRQEVLVFSVGDAAPGATPSINPDIAVSKPPVTAEEPLLAELKSFLDAVRTRTRPIVSVEDGRTALAAALEIVAEIEKHGEHLQLEALQSR